MKKIKKVKITRRNMKENIDKRDKNKNIREIKGRRCEGKIRWHNKVK